MDRDYVIQTITELLEEMKEYGTPYGMADQAYFKVIVDLESALKKAVENEGDIE